MQNDEELPKVQPRESLYASGSQVHLNTTSTVTTLDTCEGNGNTSQGIPSAQSSQHTFSDETAPKYQVYYQRLYKSLCFLESENRKLLNMIRNKVQVTGEPVPLEHLLDEFAFKVANKKDEFEKNQTTQTVAEGQQAFMAKRWKMRYHNLLDLAVLFEKQLNVIGGVENDQLLDDATTLPWKLEQHITQDIDQVIDDIALELDGCQMERSLTTYDQNDFTIFLSSVFIQDLLADYNRCAEDVKRQNETKCRLFHVLKKTKDQRNQLKRCVSEQELEIQNMQQKIQEIETELTKVARNTEKSTNRKCTTEDSTELTNRESTSNATEADDNSAPGTNADAEGDQRLIQQLLAEVHQLEYRKKEVEEMLSEEEQQRRFLSKRVQELVGTIHVSCRIRPHPNNYIQIVSDDKILCPKSLSHSPIGTSPGHVSSNDNEEDASNLMRCFIFERVFGPETGNQDIFRKFTQPLAMCLEGHHFCVMTYGSRNSGKSFTMFGANTSVKNRDTSDDGSDRGIAQESVNFLFTQAQQRAGWKYEFHIQIFAVTDGNAIDLIKCTQVTSINPNLMETGEENENTNVQELTSSTEFGRLLHTVFKNEPQQSSHTHHLLIRITIKGTQKSVATSGCDPTSSGNIASCTVLSTVLFADLASWEEHSPGSVLDTKPTRVSQSADAALPEDHHHYHHHRHHKQQEVDPDGVNQSLIALSRIFTALRRRKPQVYHDSLLTRLLKPIISGDNSRCFLIITVNSDPSEFASTLASLQFAQNVMHASTKLGRDFRAKHQLDQRQQLTFSPPNHPEETTADEEYRDKLEKHPSFDACSNSTSN